MISQLVVAAVLSQGDVQPQKAFPDYVPITKMKVSKTFNPNGRVCIVTTAYTIDTAEPDGTLDQTTSVYAPNTPTPSDYIEGVALKPAGGDFNTVVSFRMTQAVYDSITSVVSAAYAEANEDQPGMDFQFISGSCRGGMTTPPFRQGSFVKQGLLKVASNGPTYRVSAQWPTTPAAVGAKYTIAARASNSTSGFTKNFSGVIAANQPSISLGTSLPAGLLGEARSVDVVIVVTKANRQQIHVLSYL
ncbi:MAG: hypothetical protein JNJ45_11450 [Chthonomonas sp.]|nr:hypothetical protein [Chthonomonas sp.]